MKEKLRKQLTSKKIDFCFLISNNNFIDKEYTRANKLHATINKGKNRRKRMARNSSYLFHNSTKKNQL